MSEPKTLHGSSIRVIAGLFHGLCDLEFTTRALLRSSGTARPTPAGGTFTDWRPGLFEGGAGAITAPAPWLPLIFM